MARLKPRATSATARKARLVRSFLGGAPVHCTWQLTQRCESFCHLCEHRAESAPDELDASACARLAEALGRGLLVTFTGAEPFLRGDLPEIVAAVSRRHFPMLVTNGWLVNPDNARAVWTAGLEAATVSLEHADPERHDAVTGLTGSHARAVAGLSTLARERVRPGQRVNVRARLRDGEADGLPGLLAVASRHGATVTVEAPFPLPELDGAAERLVDRLRALKKRHPNLRSGGAVLQRLGQALRGGVPGCLAGRAFFNVDHLGRVSPCLERRPPAETVGSLPEQAFDELRKRLREGSDVNTCSACFYASRAEVETLYTVRGFLGGLRTLVGV